jgi:hypothetical protein
MILRFLNVQGIAGLAVSFALALLLVVQKGETRHWKKQAASFEQRYEAQRSALDTTVANYRAAAAEARADDLANLERAQNEQRVISERTDRDYEARIAAARTAAQRLRGQATAAAANSRIGGGTAVPGLPPPPGRSAKAAGEDRLSSPDALTATEQAIQLDELIKWVRAQAAVDNNSPAASPQLR